MSLRSPLPSAEPVAEGAPKLRSPLVQSEPLAEGSPHLRSPLVQSEPVAEGVPHLRAPLVQSEPLAEGVPHLRAALVLTEVIIDVPEDGPVATAIFPTLQGRSWGIKKNPKFLTATRTVNSGRETRNAFMQYPIWMFELVYEFLRDNNIANGYTYSDLRTLQGFFLQMQGSFQAFLYRDVDDYHVVGGPIATADGVTLQWPFARSFGGFLEPIGQVDLSTILTFPSSAVNTSTSQINVTGHGLANGQGPFFVSNSGGALPTGLSANTPYWAIAVDANHFELATSQPKALASTNVTLTAQGSGANTLAKGFAVYETVAEAHTVPATPGPYTITVAQAGAYLDDLGVTAGGVPLVEVASNPGAGQYSVSETTGVYTFNSAQASAAVVITYTYQAAASGVSLTLPNQLVFTVAPAAGIQVTADFDFWFVCRFTDDTTDVTQFMSKLHELQKLDFQSVIQ